MNRIFLSCLLAFAGFVISCSEDNAADPAGVQLEQGLLVVNQGNFGQGNGSLTYYALKTMAAQTDAYEIANGQPVGGIIESVRQYEDALYIVSNVEDQILVADAKSLVSKGKIADENKLVTPRYMAFSGNKAFVSVWGAYTDPDNMDYSIKNSTVAVVDLNTLQITSTIAVPASPEGMLLIEDRLYVAHTSDSLSLINTTTQALEKKVQTITGPMQFVQDAAGRLWAVHSDPWGTGNGYFVRYNQQSLEEEQRISMTGIAPTGKIQQAGSLVYFSTAAALYSIDLTATAPIPQKVLDKENLGPFWIDESSEDKYLGISDAANPGSLLHVDAAGEVQHSTPVGPFPYQILLLE